MNNVYVIYFEAQSGQYTNGQTIQCDTIQELIYQLTECVKNKTKNVNIVTIQNAKPQ